MNFEWNCAADWLTSWRVVRFGKRGQQMAYSEGANEQIIQPLSLRWKLELEHSWLINGTFLRFPVATACIISRYWFVSNRLRLMIGETRCDWLEFSSLMSLCAALFARFIDRPAGIAAPKRGGWRDQRTKRRDQIQRLLRTSLLR